jgi:hypothetical protein
LKTWLREPQRGDGQVLFPNARGGRLSADGVHYLLVRHRAAASKACPSLKHKRVTVHVLRHYLPFLTMSCNIRRVRFFRRRRRRDIDIVWNSSTLCREKGVHREMENRQSNSSVTSPGRSCCGIYRTACKITA